MKKIFRVFVLFSLFSFSHLFAQIKVISPIEGVWSNKQMLAIDNSDGEEYFYSLNGQDPISFGFAYDNPVLIDLTGDVSIIITKSGKNKETKKIQYTVKQDKADEKDYYQFIDSFFDTGVYNYTVGSEIYVPYNLKYSMNLPPDSYIEGQSISITEESVLSDIVPCVILDPQTNLKWRFLIRVFPQNQGIFSRKEVPFEIVDWKTIVFNDDNFIYKIDSEFWELPKQPKVLDRSVPHRIQWQSIEYEQGNPIQTFELPPKPEIIKNIREDGSVLFSIDGDSSFQMGIITDSNEYQELYSQICVDTFFGNSIIGNLKLQMFSNSVYQGDLEVNYSVYKKPPCQPQINTSGSESFYSRHSVSGTVIGQSDAELYVCISDPLLISAEKDFENLKSQIIDSIPEKEFSLVNGNEYRFNLDPLSDGACYYKIKSYSKKDEVFSAVSEYEVIIDKYNYYYDEEYSYEDSDGTKNHPYNNFTQCFTEINKGRNAVLNVKGKMHVPKGKNDIISNCTFVNCGDAELIFEQNASFEIKTSTLAINDFVIVSENYLDSYDSRISSLFEVENGTLDLQKCTVSANFGKNAYLFNLSMSTLFIDKSIISVSASDYCSFVNGNKSHYQINESNINVSGKTSVAISLSQGDIKLTNSTFKVTGSIGRIAELFSVEGVIKNNEFNAELPDVKNTKPVFSNDSNLIQSDNEAYGF